MYSSRAIQLYRELLAPCPELEEAQPARPATAALLRESRADTHEAATILGDAAAAAYGPQRATYEYELASQSCVVRDYSACEAYALNVADAGAVESMSAMFLPAQASSWRGSDTAIERFADFL